jgi:hypothetical protein
MDSKWVRSKKVAYRHGFIGAGEWRTLAEQQLGSGYGTYLLGLLERSD